MNLCNKIQTTLSCMSSQYMRNYTKDVMSLDRNSQNNKNGSIKLQQFKDKMKYYRSYMNNHNIKTLSMKISRSKVQKLRNNNNNDYLKNYQGNN